MDELFYSKNLMYNYHVCAVIFGADKSILNIKLKDGFCFNLKSIYSRDDNLTEIFQTDVSGLQRNYYSTLVDENYNVICIEKDINVELNPKNVEEYWNKVNDEDLKSIDDQLRIIRLMKEGPIRCKSISFNLNPVEKVESVIQPTSYYSLFPFSESYPTKNISIISCDADDILTINKTIKNITFPLEDDLLNSCHGFYDLSYHTELYISIVLLTTALETLFLQSDRCKKDILSKRCSCFISNSLDEVSDFYSRLKDVYKKRSDFLHDGKASTIEESDVLFLRNCVRRSLIKAIDKKQTKKQRIAYLKKYVESNKQLFGE